jgi:hypothetical protein
MELQKLNENLKKLPGPERLRQLGRVCSYIACKLYGYEERAIIGLKTALNLEAIHFLDLVKAVKRETENFFENPDPKNFKKLMGLSLWCASLEPTPEQMKMFLALSAGQFIAGAQEGVVADLSEREKYAEKLAELFSEALKNPDSESAQFWGPLVEAVKELSLEELDAPFSPEEYIRGMAVISAVEKGNFKPLQDKENAKTIIRGLVRTGNREITELYYAFHADELRQKVRQSIGKGMKM